MSTRSLVLLIALTSTLGCSEAREMKSVSRVAGPGAAATKEAMPADAASGATEPARTAVPASATPRKILYSADLWIVVEDFHRAAGAVVALVQKYGGYIADSDVTGSPGSNRTATWKVRIPVDKFDPFLEAVVALGDLQRRQVHSQDVTEEFYDLQTRIKNKKVEEARLVKHLTDSTGKLEDILAVEREISRVREEVERMEGRIQLLTNLAELTTVSITVYERNGYVPATAPSFGTRATRALSSSTRNLTDFLQFAAIQAISVIPWLPIWFLVAAVAWLIFGRSRRRFAPRQP